MGQTKEVSMTVRVRVPATLSANDARREVRTMLKDQCWHSLEDGELKLLAVSPSQVPWKRIEWGWGR